MRIMEKIPGGTLLISMLIAAIIHTFCPDLFKIGSMTEALFSGSSMNFILGAAVFVSGCSLNSSSLPKVIKRYGTLLVFRTILIILVCLAFYYAFGVPGIAGISTLAFVCAITSVNPTLFLALVSDCGDEIDQ